MSQESKADLEEENILQIQISRLEVSRLEEKKTEQILQYDISTKSKIKLGVALMISGMGCFILIIVNYFFVVGFLIIFFSGLGILLEIDDKRKALLSENRTLIRDRKFLLRGIIVHNKNIIKKEKRISALKELAKTRENARDYDAAIVIWRELGEINEATRVKKLMADEREQARDYDPAIKIWEELGEINEAARVRKLKSEQGSVKVAQKVVHGDEVTKTKIKDSVLNRSNIGGGTSKMQELKDLTEMKKEGLIDDDEFKQMKKEILGK